MNKLEDIITDIFEQHANAKKAVEMSQYMRNLHPFFGISKPLRTVITKPLLQELKSSPPDMALVHALWKKPQREYHYFCLDYLIATRKQWPENIIRDFEQLIISQSWWDSVDTLAVRLVSEYFKKWPKDRKKIINSWADSDNIWLNRTAIIFQLKYKDGVDEALLYDVIRKHSHSNEFFIQKAIGWALREYAYTHAASVLAFIGATPLKPLSRREALKKIA